MWQISLKECSCGCVEVEGCISLCCVITVVTGLIVIVHGIV